MAKSTNLGLELTNDSNTLFSTFRESQNGIGEDENKSNAQIIDEFAGKLTGGTTGQKLRKRSNANFDFEFVDDPKNIDFVIPANTTWSALSNSDPYKFQASITIVNGALGNVYVEAYFVELVPCANSGIALASAVDSDDDIVLTFYAIKEPTAQISGKVVVI